MPLTKEQFTKARKGGFSVDEIMSFERTPLDKEQFVTARKAGFSAQEIINIKSPKDLMSNVKDVGQKISEGYQKFQQLPGIKQGDEVAEFIAQKLEPKPSAEESTAGFVARGLIPQIGAEIVRSYKPSAFIPFVGGAKLVKPALKPLAQGIWKAIPQQAKDVLLREVTVGRGLPDKYLEMQRKSQLEKAAGEREAQDVGEVLSTAPHDMTIETPQGNKVTVKQGQPITREHARYIGRIFRKEIDLGGRESRIAEPLDVTRRIEKNIEVEVAFNPKLKSLNQELETINSQLANKELQAQGLIGKEFELPTGVREKAVGVIKEPPIKPARKPQIGVETEQIKPPFITEPPPSFAEEGQSVARGISQVRGAETTNKFINKERNALLAQRKVLSKQIMKETIKLEENVKANYYIFDRRFSEQIRTHPRYQELSAIANEGRNVMDKWSNALVASGIPKERASSIIQENVGEYMGRMYEKHLIKGISGFSPKNLRLRLNGLKNRKDLSETVLRQLGEIKEPALPTAIRVKEISASIANNKVFNAVAKNPEWTAAENITGDMVQMPKSQNLGALSGKWVTKEIANDINAIHSLKAQNKALELYSRGMSAWKYGKVVLNPATHMRNILSNSMLLDISGVNHFKQAFLIPKAINQIITKGELYQTALKNGAIGSEFVGGEVAMIEKFYTHAQGGNLDKWMNVLKAPFGKMGEMYKAEEQIAKLVKFMDSIDRGLSPSNAALESQKWLFNYTDIPNFMKVAKEISPFITFTYKSVPRVAESIVNNPLRVYKYYAFANAFNESSRKMFNMTPDEFARNEKALPPWLLKSIGGMPTNLLMPWKDKYGRTQWLNLEYILPIGMAPEIAQKGLLETVSNPLVTLYSDLAKNKDFKGKDIIPVASTNAEAAKIVTEYIYRQIAPSLSPGLLNLGNGESIFKGGYSFEKIMSAIYQKPDYADRTKDISPTVFDVLMGLKLTPIDVNESEMFKMYEKKNTINDLNKQMMKLSHPSISEEERERQTEKIFQKIQKVLEE